MKLVFALLLMAAASHTSAQVFKCPDATGRMQFQQTPCSGGSGGKLDVRPASGPAAASTGSQANGAPGVGGEKKSFTDTLAEERLQRERWVRLNDAKLDSDRQRAACEQEQRAMASRTASSNNNLAGATRNQAIASEMQAAATTCQNRVSGADRLVDRLQGECDRMGCRAPGT
ncbi:hypothetical protein J2W34_000758 [Variovorax boronicumulans]|nr:hypothetical protein [Variovorax boronicumulans]